MKTPLNQTWHMKHNHPAIAYGRKCGYDSFPIPDERWHWGVTRFSTPTGEFILTHEGGSPAHEKQATATLIAASPELYRFAKWAMSQFQGDSGTGESHWEQFPEYRQGKEAIEKAEGGK